MSAKCKEDCKHCRDRRSVCVAAWAPWQAPGAFGWTKAFFSPNSVSTLWGSYGMSKEWCTLRCPFASAGFVCARSRRVPFATTDRTDRDARNFWALCRGSVHFLKQNVVLLERRRRSDGFGGWKREFTWQLQGIGHFVKIMAGAVFCGHCQNISRCVSFEGLRFTWQAQGIRTMDPMF